MRRFRGWLVLAALAAVAAPATRWVVRVPLSGVRGGDLPLAQTILSRSDDPVLERFHAVASRLNPLPADGWRLSYRTRPADLKELPRNSAADRNELVAAAAACAAREPENGAFALAIAFGHFERGEREAGVAAVRHAARSTWFSFHTTRRAMRQVAAAERTVGHVPVGLAQAELARSLASQSNALLFGAAVHTSLEALQRESEGDLKGGLSLRRDLIAIGSRLAEATDDWNGAREASLLMTLATLRPDTASLSVSDRETRKALWRRWAHAHGASDLSPVVDHPLFSNRRIAFRPAVFGRGGADSATFVLALSAATLFSALVLAALASAAADRCRVRWSGLAVAVGGGGFLLVRGIAPLLETFTFLSSGQLAGLCFVPTLAGVSAAAFWSFGWKRAPFSVAARTGAKVALVAYLALVVVASAWDSVLRRDVSQALRDPAAYARQHDPMPW